MRNVEEIIKENVKEIKDYQKRIVYIRELKTFILTYESCLRREINQRYEMDLMQRFIPLFNETLNKNTKDSGGEDEN